jgi:hypothetical protein
VPLVVRVTGANVPDQNQLPALLAAMPAVQGPRGRPKIKPDALVGDRAYGTADMIALVLALRIVSLLAPRGDDTHGSGWARGATWSSGRWPASATSAGCACATSGTGCTSKRSMTWRPAYSFARDSGGTVHSFETASKNRPSATAGKSRAPAGKKGATLNYATPAFMAMAVVPTRARAPLGRQ